MGSVFVRRGLRFLLLAGMLAVCGLTFKSFLAQQRKRGTPGPRPPKMAADVDQQARAFVLSKTAGGQMLYTLQASQMTNFKDTGKTILRNVSIQIFGKRGDRRDRVTSQECEVDTAKSTFFLPGEVQMELQAPEDVSGVPAKQQPSGPIYITTSALIFDQNTGMAATEKEVRFRFAGGEGSSQGAVYNPQDQTLTMKKEAKFTFWQNPDEPKESVDDEKLTYVQADSLLFQRTQRKILLTAPVQIRQGTREVQAGDSEILLDEEQRAQQARLGGGVHGTDQTPQGSAEVRANRGEIEFTPQGKVGKLLLVGSTSWSTTSAQSRREGQAERAELFFKEPEGILSRVEAQGEVRVLLRPLQSERQPELRASENPRSLVAFQDPNSVVRIPDAQATNGSRVLLTQQAEMILAPDGETLREVRTQSPSTLQLFPSKPGENIRIVQGDHFVMEFSAGGNLSEFTAEGNAKVAAEGTGPNGSRRNSTSDHLWANFDPQTHSVERMRQWGHFYFEEPERQARADRADYTAEGDVVVLQGEPLTWNSSGKLSAQKISLGNLTSNSAGEIIAEGSVVSTDFPTPSPGSPPPDPIHVVADHLQYSTKTGKAEYQGHARMWQGTDIIEADWLELDRQKQQLLARNGVYSVFPGRSQSQSEKPEAGSYKSEAITPKQQLRNSDSSQQKQPSGAGRKDSSTDFSGPFLVRSDSLVYKQEQHMALYRGNVRMLNASATLNSDELQLLLKPPANQTRSVPSSSDWQVERVIATGNVVIIQPQRKSTGNRAEYIPEQSKMILSGNLAVVTDSQRGTTQGAQLTYFTNNDSIFVQGGPDSPAESRRPVKR